MRTRARTEAWIAGVRGDTERKHRHQRIARSARALESWYHDRETEYADTMEARREYARATEQERHLAVAADSEYRRRHPDADLPRLRSAEPEPVTGQEREALWPDETGRTGAARAADTWPAHDPGYTAETESPRGPEAPAADAKPEPAKAGGREAWPLAPFRLARPRTRPRSRAAGNAAVGQGDGRAHPGSAGNARCAGLRHDPGRRPRPGTRRRRMASPVRAPARPAARAATAGNPALPRGPGRSGRAGPGRRSRAFAGIVGSPPILSGAGEPDEGGER